MESNKNSLFDDLVATAELARLDISEAELRSALPAFEEMVNYFAEMEAADDDIAAFGKPLSEFGRSALKLAPRFFRPDNGAGVENYNPSFSLNEKFVENSPEHDGPFIVVPNVL
jgi:Asp-tRNA(Asn)/Glu-tRNA(Gln) amidotransferase C subunit